MPIVRILLVLFALAWAALASPALAQDGARKAAAAGEAAQAFRAYVEGVAKKGGRPDPTRPEVAALFDRVFDLAALNALPAVQANDLLWLMDWMQAANTVNKSLMLFGSRPGVEPDMPAIEANMTQYADQYAAMMNFMIRGQARQSISMNLFMASLAPEQRTRIREEGYTKARSSQAQFILSVICAAIQGSAKPDNARLVAAAIRDTRETWADFFLPKDRARTIELLADLSPKLPDEIARNDIAAFTAALRAVKI